MEILFSRYNKFVYNKYNKKTKDEYVLNIDKIVKNKMNGTLMVMNKYQAFILNYEIVKLLQKVMNSSTIKYKKIVYVNQDMGVGSILNLKNLVEEKYPDVKFDYKIIYDEDDEDMVDAVKEMMNIETIKTDVQQ